MKTFEIELRRTSFITVTVEADTEDQAEALAWEEVPDTKDAAWTIESIEELT